MADDDYVLTHWRARVRRWCAGQSLGEVGIGVIVVVSVVLGLVALWPVLTGTAGP